MKTINSIFTLTILIFITNNFKLTAQTDEAFSQSKTYFNINIPKEFSISCPYGIESNTADYSDYEIRYKDDTLNYITITSYTLGRTSCYEISDCYNGQLLEWEKTINISYKVKKEKWYVISGVGKYTGRIFYLKGYYGDNYYSELKIVYPKDIKSEFENYIPDISKSFKGK